MKISNLAASAGILLILGTTIGMHFSFAGSSIESKEEGCGSVFLRGTPTAYVILSSIDLNDTQATKALSPQLQAKKIAISPTKWEMPPVVSKITGTQWGRATLWEVENGREGFHITRKVRSFTGWIQLSPMDLKAGPFDSITLFRFRNFITFRVDKKPLVFNPNTPGLPTPEPIPFELPGAAHYVVTFKPLWQFPWMRAWREVREVTSRGEWP